MRIALDTNILVYLAGLARVDADLPKIEVIRVMLPALAGAAEIVIPTQALGELYTVFGRAGRTRPEQKEVVLRVRAQFQLVGSDEETLMAALDLASDHQLQIWDSLIVNAAADAGCTLLLSEDMQSGFSWRGVTVINPFEEPGDARFVRLISSP